MKVTLQSIHNKIKNESYIGLPDGRSTLCMLTLENGYTINGISSCVDASEFDRDVGRQIAFNNAIQQIWPLEGYLLAEKLFRESNPYPKPEKPLKAPSKTSKAPYGLKKDGTPKAKPGRKAA